MDEEEVQQPKQKINLDSFFNRLDTVEKVANDGLKQSKLNVNAIKANKTLIDSISVSIEAMQTQIRDIANFIVIERKLEKDAEEDRRFEAEDKAQKAKMDERLKQLIPEKKEKKVESPPEEKKGGFMAGLLKVIGGLGLIAGLAALVTLALPVLGPILLGALGVGLVALVFAKLGPPLYKWVKGMFSKIKNFLDKSFKPIEKIPVVGKGLKRALSGGLIGGIGGVGSAVAGALIGALKGGEGSGNISGGDVSGGDGGVTSDSNMNLESGESGEKNLEKTLKKQNLIENKEEKDLEKDLETSYEFTENLGDTTYSESYSESEDGSQSTFESNFEGKPFKFDRDTGKMHLLGVEITTDGANEYMNLSLEEKTNIDVLKEIVKKYKVTKIEPESNKGNKEVIQSSSKNSNASTIVVANDMKNEKIISKPQFNSQILTGRELPQVSQAEIKGTGTTISYIRALSNQYLSISNNKLPPEVARMIQ